jgi:Cft2 family RNA processing exonuclease
MMDQYTCKYINKIRTYPTKAIAPILLEDFSKILSGKGNEDSQFFTEEDIKNCMKKVTGIKIISLFRIKFTPNNNFK